MDPAFACGCGPLLLCGEDCGYAAALCVYGHALGLEVDVRHLHAVEVGRELDVLDCVVDVLGDVVVEEVLVEACGDEPHTHRGNESGHAFIHESLVGIGREVLVVADLAEGELAGEEPGGATGDEVRGELGLVDGRAVVGALIPGILAPDVLGDGCRDGLLEGSSVAEGVLERVAVHLHLGGSLGGDEVHDTAECDTPGLCGGVGGSVDLHGEVRLVLRVVLVYAVGICAAGVRDRNEVDVLPGAVVVGTVATVSADGSDGLVPDLEDLHELLCESLEGSGCAEVLGGDVCRKGRCLLVLGECAEQGDGHTVGGECEGVCTLALHQGLVGHGSGAGGSIQETGCEAGEVLGSLFQGGAALHCDLGLVIAVAVGVLGRFVTYDDDVVLVAGCDADKSLCQCILVLGSCKRDGAGLGDRLALHAQGRRNGGFLFPRCISGSCGVDHCLLRDLGYCSVGIIRTRIGLRLVLTGCEYCERRKCCCQIQKDFFHCGFVLVIKGIDKCCHGRSFTSGKVPRP